MTLLLFRTVMQSCRFHGAECLSYQVSFPSLQILLSPGQTDRQVVASGRKCNLHRDLGWVAKRTRKFYHKYTQVTLKTF